MKITNIRDKTIKALCHFNYRGYIVSISTFMAANMGECAYWEEGYEDGLCIANGVEDAINKINKALEAGK
jgi:hypothetical protein